LIRQNHADFMVVRQENDPGVVELLWSGLAISTDCGLEGRFIGRMGSNLNSFVGESQKMGTWEGLF